MFETFLIILMVVGAVMVFLKRYEIVEYLTPEPEGQLELVTAEVFEALLAKHQTDLVMVEIPHPNQSTLVYQYADTRLRTKLMSVRWPNVTYFYANTNLTNKL